VERFCFVPRRFGLGGSNAGDNKEWSMVAIAARGVTALRFAFELFDPGKAPLRRPGMRGNDIGQGVAPEQSEHDRFQRTL
jgi:hypothetical protein